MIFRTFNIFYLLFVVASVRSIVANKEEKSAPFQKIYEHRAGNNLSLTMELLIDYHKLVKAAVHGDNLEGFMAAQPRQVYLYELIGSTPWIQTICETGFNGGHSAFSLLFSSGKNVLLRSFDLSFQPSARLILESLFGSWRFTFIAGDTTNTLPQYIASNPSAKCDVFSVDGGHSFDVAFKDMNNFKTISTCDNFVLVDDVFQKYAQQWGATHVNGVKDAWQKAVKDGLVEQYGCYEYYEDVPNDSMIDPGVWGGKKKLPRAFCIGSFILDKAQCPEGNSKSKARVMQILSEMNLHSCASGCCNTHATGGKRKEQN